MSEAEKDANLKVIESMSKRLNYLRNPRFKEEKPPILMATVTSQKLLIVNRKNLQRSLQKRTLLQLLQK